jgi:hypothetical protein
LSTVTTATPNSPIDISSCSSSIIEEPTKIAKALAEVLSATSLTTNNNKQSLSQPSAAVSTEITTNKPDTKSNTSTTTTTTNNTTNNNSTAKPPTTAANTNTATTPSPFLSGHEPTTEIKEGVEWVSFVYSHHRTLRRYCIRTDLDQVDTSILDEKFKKENCVSIFIIAAIYFYFFNTFEFRSIQELICQEKHIAVIDGLTKQNAMY